MVHGIARCLQCSERVESGPSLLAPVRLVLKHSALIGLLFAGSLTAYPQSSAGDANADIVKMIQAGLPEGAIVDKIQVRAGRWDTSVDALIALKRAGATDAEIKAVTAALGPVTPPSPSSSPLRAQSYVTLEQTVQYIEDQLTKEEKVTETFPTGESAPIFNQHLKLSGKCSVLYSYRHPDGNYEMTVYLADADAFSIAPIQRGSSWTLNVQQKPYGPHGFLTSNAEAGKFNTPEAMLRVAKAYIHAITSCHEGSGLADNDLESRAFEALGANQGAFTQSENALWREAFDAERARDAAERQEADLSKRSRTVGVLNAVNQVLEGINTTRAQDSSRDPITEARDRGMNNINATANRIQQTPPQQQIASPSSRIASVSHDIVKSPAPAMSGTTGTTPVSANRSAATSSVCPASGFIPDASRSVASDVSEGVPCTPGQPYTTGASPTSNRPPASVSSPSSGTKEMVSGMSTCLTSSYANGEYGLSLTFTNACPVAVRVRFFVGPKANGADHEMASGTQWISPWRATDVQRQGAVSYFACPLTYPVFVGADGRGVESGTHSYHCEKKTY